MAAPLNTNTQLLWYRKDLVPNPPQTWDQMIDIAVALAERDLPHYVEVQGAVRGHHGLVQHTPASAASPRWL